MTPEEAAAAPKRSVIGGETIEEHSLPDRIEFERWKAQQEAAAAVVPGRSMLKRTRLTHPRP
jgi:hypothetical protein